MPDTMVVRESRLRSILKAATWRLLATLTTWIIALAITRQFAIAAQIASIEVVVKMVVYYFHERAWQQVPRGSIRKRLGDKG